MNVQSTSEKLHPSVLCNNFLARVLTLTPRYKTEAILVHCTRPVVVRSRVVKDDRNVFLGHDLGEENHLANVALNWGHLAAVRVIVNTGWSALEQENAV